MTEVDILKRFLAFFCVLSFALSAVAFGTTFTRTVQCVNQNDYVKSAMSNEKDNDDHRIYVHYNAQGCSTATRTISAVMPMTQKEAFSAEVNGLFPTS